MTRREHICINCEKKYVAYHDYSKYCSKKCEYEIIKIKERECPICKNIFIPVAKKQIHCNIKCYSKSPKLKEYAKNSFLIKTNKTRIFNGIRNDKPNSGSFKKGQTCGDKNSNWKGGITSLCEQIRKCNNYKEWKITIFSRDNWKCKICEMKIGDLNAHHIKHFSKILSENNIKNIKDAINCKELWDINNGITLCKKCHIIIHEVIK